jgi:hypothetical protein
MGVIGLLGQGASISGWNNLITNCAQSCAAFTIGGSYRFAYSTFANFWTGSVRQAPAFLLNNYYLDFNNNLQVRPLTNTWFHNCIMWGNNANLNQFSEFIVDVQNDDQHDYRFEYCSVDAEQDLSSPLRFYEMVNGTTPPFVAPSSGDFHLSVNISSAWQAGFPSGPTWSWPTDLDFISRSLPGRKGCYEGQ